MHEDFLGSTTRLTDSSQATTGTRQYDAFGNVVSTSGSNPMPFGFAGGWGYQSDADSGLQLLGHRYYDPSTGRFLTQDRVGDGRNWYAYCGSRPTSWIDPWGLYHVIVHFHHGEGIATVYADDGDVVDIDDSAKPIRGRHGQIVSRFPVSNHPKPPHKPFPVGTWYPDGVEHGRNMGPNFLVFRKAVDPGEPGARGTWFHSGAGDNWRKPTLGCVRGTETDINRLSNLYYIQKHYNPSVKMRITVTAN